MRIVFLFAVLFLCMHRDIKSQTQHKAKPISQKQARLSSLAYEELPLGAIQPKGWLKQQLMNMKAGSTGHLDETFAKISADNGWLGGKGDDWEETLYWLDGAVPLAYILKDDTLKQKVLRYINWSIEHQRPSGFFGPYSKDEREGKKTEMSASYGADWWPRMIMLKVMQQYYSATKDERVILFMKNYFRYQLKGLQASPLNAWGDWAKARGGENIMSVCWLYRKTGEPFLLELAEVLYRQTTPWTTLLGARNWVMESASQQNGSHWMERHGVNVGMGIKLPAIYYQLTKSKAYLDSLKTGFNDLMLLHGLPYGMFSADEDLHGNLPMQGTELCAIVETMFSLEEIIAISGDNGYGDALERMTFNALPTQTTEDYINRQYFQVANQVTIKRGVSDFSLPFDRGMNNVFGPYAGYTCCTSNMHQGWTKFTSHLWYGTPAGGLAAMLYSPNTITAIVDKNKTITIDEDTRYPFSDQISFTISTQQPVNFPMELRIPSWCKLASLSLNGKVLQSGIGGSMMRISRIWQNKDQLVLTLPMQVRTSNWGRNSRTIERGPLVYALKVPGIWKKDSLNGEREFTEGVYYEVTPAADWNYGIPKYVIDNPEANLKVVEKQINGNYVWSEDHPPVAILLPGKKIPGWQLNANNVADQPVTTRADIYQGETDSKETILTFIPYGCTKLRVVAFPVVK